MAHYGIGARPGYRACAARPPASELRSRSRAPEDHVEPTRLVFAERRVAESVRPGGCRPRSDRLGDGGRTAAPESGDDGCGARRDRRRAPDRTVAEACVAMDA